MSKYAKFFTALGTALTALAAAAGTDGNVSTEEWWTIAIAFVGALGVYFVPNKAA